MTLKISTALEAEPLDGSELLIVAQLSPTITITATTLATAAADNSINDSANGFVAAGFSVGDRVNIAGFTGNVANNIFSAKVTALTAAKMTIGGTDGDVIVDDAAGESVTISKWESRRATAQDIADLGGGSGSPQVESFVVALSDEDTAITAGAAKFTMRMPYAFLLSDVRANLTVAQTSGSILTVDVNEAGASILSTKLTIDNTEETSTGATTPRVISDTGLADDAEITFDVDQVGDGTAKGLKVTLIGTRVP